jgi:mannose-6-phosphate isomerase-like protein (cupin superfamily)
MDVTRIADARPYDAKGHFGVTALRLQGLEATRVGAFWIGLSHFQPGGGAEMSASDVERVYVVQSGEITVVTDAGEVVLKPMDSCEIAPGERRAVFNRGTSPASMLVIVAKKG